MAKRIWWGTWPGAIAMALLALILVLPGAAAGLVALLIPDTGSAGTDRAIGTTPVWVRVFGALAVSSAVALPLLVLRWARKTWLGYLLLGLGLSLLIGAIGLGLFGVI